MALATPTLAPASMILLVSGAITIKKVHPKANKSYTHAV
jgi:hypothetical protein